MKKSFITFIVIAVSFSLSARDKIITKQNDTIYCRIKSITDSHILYEQRNGNLHVVGKMIPFSNVNEYHRYSREKTDFLQVEHPWLFSINGGAGYLPWLLDNFDSGSEENINTENIIDKLSNGFQFSSSVHYLINHFIGTGLHYSFFTSGYKGDYPVMVNPMYPTYSQTHQEERQFINYGGVSVVFQQLIGLKRKIQLSETISGGILFYRAESQLTHYYPLSSGYSVINNNTLAEGSTFGATIGLSAGYFLRPNLSVGIGGEFLYGKLKKVDFQQKDSQGGGDAVDDVELEKALNLSRINYSIVFRYYL